MYAVTYQPTQAALAGLPPPPDLDGIDLSPLWTQPTTALKEAVYSEYPRCPKDISTPWDDTSSCVHTQRKLFTSMGYSVRTDNFRYTTVTYSTLRVYTSDFTPWVGLISPPGYDVPITPWVPCVEFRYE